MRTSILAVGLGAGIGALANALCGPLGTAQTQNAGTVMTCTNPVSGASWQIRVDYNRSTVDSHPARISDATIAWHDPKDNGNYTLDRKTGRLTVIVASSTGGAFFYDRCRQEN